MMSKRHPKRKLGGGRFARLPLTLLQHEAVTTLNHAAFRVLVLLTAQYHGANNGALGLTANQAAVNGIGSRHTFYGALKELEVRGLIQMTYLASRVPPRPTMYALTWVPLDDTNYCKAERVANHGYKDWKPAPKQRRSRLPKLRVIGR